MIWLSFRIRNLIVSLIIALNFQLT